VPRAVIMAPIRLAILLCDTPPPPVLKEEGDYHKIFDVWLRSTSPVDFTLEAFDVVNKMEYPPEDAKYDGIILTGSAASAYEDVEWINKLVEYASGLPHSKPDVKLFGICFGHQIIGRALGGTCTLNSQWEVGITEVQLTEIGQRIFGVKSLNIQEMHRDHVPTVLSGFELLGSTGVCHNQGMVRYIPDASGGLAKLSDIQIFTVQGHPEFTKSIVSKIVKLRADKGLFTPEFAQDAVNRNELRNDGVEVIARTVWKIIGATHAEN